jgi:hypothetical protein
MDNADEIARDAAIVSGALLVTIARAIRSSGD